MDWDFAIERNRGVLLGIVAMLFAKIGLTEDGTVDRLPRPLYRFVLRLLRPAEAAVRRLIIVMARDIVVKPRPKRPAPSRPVIAGKGQSKVQDRPQSFQLFDPHKRSDAGKRRRRRNEGGDVGPRIHVFGYDPRIPEFLRGQPAPAAPPLAPEKDGTVNARRLCRRLIAIIRALEDLPRQAKRLALWRARPKEDRRPRRDTPLRLGWPPGWRIRPTHDVHEILKECHWLVRSLPAVDTS